MSWLRIDDKFARHEKITALSDKAFRLHVAAMCNCADMLTDGRVTVRDVRMLLPVISATTYKRYVNELVHARLWSEHGDGWKIKDYLEYNPSSVKVKEQRQRNAERQARHRGSNAVTNGVSHGVSNAAPTPTPNKENNHYEVNPRDVGALERLKDLTDRIGRAI
jgi:hypothetical protein